MLVMRIGTETVTHRKLQVCCRKRVFGRSCELDESFEMQTARSAELKMLRGGGRSSAERKLSRWADDGEGDGMTRKPEVRGTQRGRTGEEKQQVGLVLTETEAETNVHTAS